MPWYAGPPLLDRLETIPVEPPAVHGARLPVQLVLRGEGGARWAAGRLAAGALKAGDEVVVLPCGTRTRVAEVRDADGTAEQVEAPLSVSDPARGRGRPRARRADRRRRGRARADARAARPRCAGSATAPPASATASCSSTAPAPSRRGWTRSTAGSSSRRSSGRPPRSCGSTTSRTCSLRLGGEIAADAYEQCHATGAFILDRRGDERHRRRGHGLLEPLDHVVQREEALPGEREAVLGLQLAVVDMRRGSARGRRAA